MEPRPRPLPSIRLPWYGGADIAPGLCIRGSPETCNEALTQILLMHRWPQVLNGQLMHKQKRYYEAVTRYRYAAEKDDRYLPAAFPLAFFETIEAEAKPYGLNPFLACGLIWQESQYKPDIKSWVGATGLMQIMPSTGSQIANELELEDYSLSDAKMNIKWAPIIYIHATRSLTII